MDQTTKVIIGIVVLAVVIWSGYALLSNREPVSTETIKIGVVAPLTGDLAFIGEGLRDAILLAKDSLGDTRYTYEVIFEDDQLDPKRTASAANKLISIDKVDAIISISSGTGNVVTPIAERNSIVHFGIASDANIAKGDFNFIHWTPPAEETKVFVAELQRRGITKLGIFVVNQQGELAIANDLISRIEGTDIEVVTNQLFNFGETDFRTIIAKAKPSNAEIYLLLAFTPEIEILARQIKEAGITIPLTAIESFELTEERDLFEGEWYVNAADPTGDFVDRFKEKTGGNPKIGAPNGYDIFNLIVSAAESTKSSAKPTPREIADVLLDIKEVSGALGTLNINEEGIVISKAVVRIIKDGEPVTLSE